MRGAAKRVAIEVAGWALVLGGIAALILPGPGLLMLAGGLVILSQQYEWAERRVKPVKRSALNGARQGVETWPRVVASVVGVLLLAGAGILWITSPPAPSWWPASDGWWLPGGLATGITQVVSAAVAFGLVVWSWRRYGRPGVTKNPDSL